MSDISIKLSFTALALGLREADVLIPLWNTYQNWSEAHKEVLKNNLFQKPSDSSSSRIFRELRPRLTALSADETLQIYPNLNKLDRSIVLLTACTSHYPFIHEFINTTIYDKVLVFDTSLTHCDFKLKHPTMEHITDSSKKKVRQVLWRILTEASLLSSTKSPQITPLVASPEVRQILARETPQIPHAL